MDSPKEDSSEYMQVYVRCRPLINVEKEAPFAITVSNGNKSINILENSNDKSVKRSFTFDQVFAPIASQLDVYEETAKSMIDDVISGYNCTLIAYGQSGTGKTYTMEGETSNELYGLEEDPKIGIAPRAVHQLFDVLTEFKTDDVSVHISYIGIRNDKLIDLLNPAYDVTKIKLYEVAGKQGSLLIHGLEEVHVFDKFDVFRILDEATKRKNSIIDSNNTSNKIHTVLNILVRIKDVDFYGAEAVRVGKLCLVDLAGSEYPNAASENVNETSNTNQDLFTLRRVINALIEKNSHIPYRESKLTRILKDSFGGNVKTSIIATVSPSFHCVEETLDTLEYANKMKCIINSPEVNKKAVTEYVLNEYVSMIKTLRKEISCIKEKRGILVDAYKYKTMEKNLQLKKERLRDLQNVQQDLRKQISDCKESIEETETKTTEIRHYTEMLLKDTEVMKVRMNCILEEVAEANKRLKLKTEDYQAAGERLQEDILEYINLNGPDVKLNLDKTVIDAAAMKECIDELEQKHLQGVKIRNYILNQNQHSIMKMRNLYSVEHVEYEKELCEFSQKMEAIFQQWKHTIASGTTMFEKVRDILTTWLNGLQPFIQRCLQTCESKPNADMIKWNIHIVEAGLPWMKQMTNLLEEQLKTFTSVLSMIRLSESFAKMHVQNQILCTGQFFQNLRDVSTDLIENIGKYQTALQMLEEDFYISNAHLPKERDSFVKRASDELESVIKAVEYVRSLHHDYNNNMTIKLKQNDDRLSRMWELHDKSYSSLVKFQQTFFDVERKIELIKKTEREHIDTVFKESVDNIGAQKAQFKEIVEKTKVLLSDFVKINKQNIVNEAQKVIDSIGDLNQEISKINEERKIILQATKNTMPVVLSSIKDELCNIMAKEKELGKIRLTVMPKLESKVNNYHKIYNSMQEKAEDFVFEISETLEDIKRIAGDSQIAVHPDLLTSSLKMPKKISKQASSLEESINSSPCSSFVVKSKEHCTDILQTSNKCDDCKACTCENSEIIHVKPKKDIPASATIRSKKQRSVGTNVSINSSQKEYKGCIPKQKLSLSEKAATGKTSTKPRGGNHKQQNNRFTQSLKSKSDI